MHCCNSTISFLLSDLYSIFNRYIISYLIHLFVAKLFRKNEYLPWSTIYLDAMHYNLRIFQVCTVCQIIFNISSFNSFCKSVFRHTQSGYIVEYASPCMFLTIPTGVHGKGMRKRWIETKLMISSYNYLVFMW